MENSQENTISNDIAGDDASEPVQPLAEDQDEILQAAILSSLSRQRVSVEDVRDIELIQQPTFSFAANRLNRRRIQVDEDSDSDEEMLEAMESQLNAIDSNSPPSQSLDWKHTYQTVMAKSNLTGDKISLPPSALDAILQASVGPLAFSMAQSANLPHPLIFVLTNTSTQRKIYAGVRQFSSEEDTVEIPLWMYESLGLQQDSSLEVKVTTLPKADHLKLAPLSADYIDIPDVRSLLENFLRREGFTTLTVGETLQVKTSAHTYPFLVVDAIPEGLGGVCVIDVEPSVDIAPLDEEIAKDAVSKKMGLNGTRSKVIELTWQSHDLETESANIIYSSNLTHSQEYSFPTFPTTPYYNITLTGDAELYVALEDEVLSPLDFLQCSIDLISPKHLFINCFPGDDQVAPITPSHAAIDLTQSVTKTWASHVHVLLVPHDNAKITLEIHPTDSSEPTLPIELKEEHDVDSAQCDNCKQWIPKRTLAMHSAFCTRNNIPCDVCGKVLNKKEKDAHWHCPKCDFTTQDEDLSIRTWHGEKMHTEMECECLVDPHDVGFGHHRFSGLLELVHHKRFQCPERVVTCRFCHLKVRAGPQIVTRTGEHVGEHEESCGSRTVKCDACGVPIRLKEVVTHGKIHQLEKERRKEHVASGKGLGKLCSNQMCGRFIPIDYPGNILEACRSCFGPFWIPTQDVGHQKLIQRLIATYHAQLTRSAANVCPAQQGCKNPWCSSSRCYQGPMLNANDAAIKALELAKQSSVMKGPGMMWLCQADVKSQDRRMLAREIKQMGGWKEEVVVKALAEIERDRGEMGHDRLIDTAVSWLFENT
jgi:hypothetical protein